MSWEDKKEWDTTNGEKIFSSDLNRIEDKIEDLHINKTNDSDFNTHDNTFHTDNYGKIYIVTSETDRNNITDQDEGDLCYVENNNETYIWNGTDTWLLVIDEDNYAQDPHNNTQHSTDYATQSDFNTHDNTFHTDNYAQDPHNNTQHSTDYAQDPHDNTQHSTDYATQSDFNTHDNTFHTDDYAQDPHDNTQHSTDYAQDPHNNTQHSTDYATQSDFNSHGMDKHSYEDRLKVIYGSVSSDNLRHEVTDGNKYTNDNWRTILTFNVKGPLEGFKVISFVRCDNDTSTNETGIDFQFEILVNGTVVESYERTDQTIGYYGKEISFDGTMDIDYPVEFTVRGKIQNNTDSYVTADNLRVYYDTTEKLQNSFEDDI